MIFYIRSLKALLISILIIVIAELFVLYQTGYEQNRRMIGKEALLYLNYGREDVSQAYMIGYKNYIFFNEDAEFVQIGDSSGFYGLKPQIIQEYLNEKYINGSCCFVMGWDGYYGIGERYLKNNKKRKYLVLYLTPYTILRSYADVNLEIRLHDLYSSLWGELYQFPSIYFRKKIVETLYYGRERQDEDRFMKYIMGEYIPADQNYLGFMADNLGWLPYSKKPGELAHMPVEECGPDMIKDNIKIDQNLVIDNLAKIKNLSDKYQVKMILLFNPVACRESSQIKDLVDAVNKFHQKYPDVIMPFNLISTQDKEDFSDESHLNPEAAEINSARIGKALIEILKINTGN